MGEKPDRYDLADYVLGHFSGEDRETMEESYKRAVHAVELLAAGELEQAMNEYNKKVKREE